MRIILGILGVSALLQAEVPRQLNVHGFSACLGEVRVNPNLRDLERIKDRYDLSSRDELLLHLAVYPGKSVPGLDGDRQAKALEKWSGRWDREEEVLARSLLALAQGGAPLVPNRFYGEALHVCGGDDFFCATLLAHNVLRTLGRNEQAIQRDEKGRAKDFNPAWFRETPKKWLDRAKQIQASLISFRRDGKGDRWGEWYHAFGIFTFAIHEAALGRRPSSVQFIAELNRLLNPLLAGAPEEPEKARVDRDAVDVMRLYLGEGLPDGTADCSARAAYVF